MKIKKITKIHHEDYVPVYDVINAEPLHNFVISSHSSKIISHNCMMDEVNFLKAGVKDINIGKARMRSLYNTANARIAGTFRLHGEVYGKMFVCSSKNTDNDYLSDHIEEQLNAGNIHMYLFDKPQWEVLPSRMFSSEKFYITVGDRYKRGFVIPKENEDEEHLQAYKDQGYRILEVPKDYETNFRADYDIALRDIAGISVIGAMGFITQESITPCVAQDRHNPFYEDVIITGGKDNDTIENHFHLEAVPKEIKRIPMNIHIDFAEVSDHTGICGVGPDGTKIVFDHTTEKKVVMPFYRQIFQVAIEAPPGDRMSFQKVINFILWLRRNGFHITTVTTDQYQSAFVRESLEHLGFATDKVSVDKSEDPYIGLRNLLQDQRIELVKHELQEQELIHLQRLNGRIDHPPQTGSGPNKGIGKDCSDALCLSGDTIIYTLDGKSHTIQEMYETQQSTTYYVLSHTGESICPNQVQSIVYNGIHENIVKLTLDTGEELIVTCDHLIMCRDGSYVKAEDSVGRSLMPFIHEQRSMWKDRQYEWIEVPLSNNSFKGEWLHKIVANHYKQNEIDQLEITKSDKEFIVIHHDDEDRMNNNPENLIVCTNVEHCKIHASRNSSEKKRKQLSEAHMGVSLKDCMSLEDYQLYNHRVVKIDLCPPCNVYDIKLKIIHNFALACGVFVHNCGSAWQCIQTQDQVKPRGTTLAKAISNVNGPAPRVMSGTVNLGLSNRPVERSDPRMPQVFAPGIRRL